MKTLKTILFVALIIFHVTTIVIISIGKSDLNFLFDLFKQMDLVQYAAILGLILFLAVIFLFQIQERSKKKLIERHEQEINQIKARLYDKNEAATNEKTKSEQAASSTPKEEPKKEEDKSDEKPETDQNNQS